MHEWQECSCPPETLLIRLAAEEGGLEATQRDRLENHLAQCPACRESLAAIRQVRAQLGQWELEVPRHDLADAVVAQTRQRPHAARVGWALRIAASVLISGAVGFGIGRWSRPAAPAPASSVPDDEAVAMALGLDTLAEQTDLLGTVDFSGAGAGTGAGETR